MLFVFRVEESYEVVDLKHVYIQSGENVYVTWAEDPTNFRVCTLNARVVFVFCLSLY